MAKKWWVLLVVVCGDVHVAPRRDDRCRGAARHPKRTPFLVLRRAVGRRCLCPDPGLAAPHGRDPGRPVRSETPLPDRPGNIHRRLAAVRIGAEPDDADRLESPPGGRWSDPVRNLPGSAGPDLPRAGAGRRVRRVGRGHRYLDCSGTDPRRDYHERHQLAGHLPGQHPDRGGRDRHRGVAARRIQAIAHLTTGLGRLRHSHCRTGRPRLWPHSCR